MPRRRTPRLTDPAPRDPIEYLDWLQVGDEFDHLRAYVLAALLDLEEGGYSHPEIARRHNAVYGGKMGADRLYKFINDDRPGRSVPPAPRIQQAVSIIIEQDIPSMWDAASRQWRESMKKQAADALAQRRA